MARMTPGLNLRVENTLQGDGSEMAVQLKFKSMEDFEPANVVAAGRAAPQAAGDPRQAPRPADQGGSLARTWKSVLEQVLENTDELKKLSVGTAASNARQGRR